MATLYASHLALLRSVAAALRSFWPGGRPVIPVGRPLGRGWLLLVLLGLFLPRASWADSGLYRDFVILQAGPGTTNTYYYTNLATPNPNYQGTNLGTFTRSTGGRLLLQGAEVSTYQHDGVDMQSAQLVYRVYPAGDNAGAFTTVNLPYRQSGQDGDGGNKQWAQTAATIDLLAQTTQAGSYVLEVYLQAQGRYNGGALFTNYDSRSGANYRATFTVADEGLVADSTELRVLRQFYQATGGSAWTTHASWLQGTTLADAATWAGVTVTANDVSGLNLRGELTGTLPPSLGLLRGLNTISLNDNRFTGGVPDLRACTRLQSVELSGSGLTGPLPDLSQSVGLQVLVLRGNQFTGTLPPYLGQLQWLRTLYLDGNQLTGPLPELRQLVSLEYLDLSRNHITGLLPDGLSQCSHLLSILLYFNQFTGPLPPSWGGLSRLGDVSLTGNYLSGSIPTEWKQLSLVDLDLGSNHVTYGLFPNSTSANGGNHLTGTLNDIPNPRGIRYLSLNGNQFSGSLQALAGMVSLDAVNLESNQFTGPLPADLSQLAQLRYVNLDNNRLTGTLPASLLRHPTLQEVHLAGIGLTDVEDVAGYTAAGVWLYLADNYLGFPALERLYQGPQQDRFVSRLIPQRPVLRVDTASYTAGGPLVLHSQGAIGNHTYRYQWQRQVAGQWLEMPGDTLATKTWAAASAAEQGTYRLVVHDRWFTDAARVPTELYSAAVYANMLPYLPLNRNLPDDANRGLVLARPYQPLDSAATAPADMNYVRSWVPRVALTAAPTAPTIEAPNWTVAQASRTTQYLDGLGRPVQTVRHGASPQGRDLVQPQAYDGLGREPRAYLPYPADTTHQASNPLSAVGYHYRPLTEQQRFYLPTGQQGPPNPATDPTPGVARTGVAYAETLFEASPLNRVLAQGAPGEAWRLTGGHVTERLERPNTRTDSVAWFRPGYDPRNLDPGYQGFYPDGELWGVEVMDPHGPAEPGAHGYKTIEWKDKLGQVVGKQVEAARAGRNDSSRWLRTAYAYDDFQRLRFVLQPEATRRVLTLGNQAAPLPGAALPFLFHYRYDGRGRQVAKQVPGQDGETLVVYDQLDRPVLSQDAQQRQRREWSWSKYDALGRLLMSGLTTRQDTAGQVSLQAVATADTATAHQYEQRTAQAGAYPHFYTTDQSFPRLGQAGFAAGQVLSVSYYDDYDFDNNGQPDVAYDPSQDGQFAAGPAPVADALRTTGMPTRTKTRVLGVAENDATQAAWLTSTTFYDERARPVQVQTTNARQGTDLLTTQLDFTGKVTQSVATHQGPGLAQPLTVAEFFTYDHADRLLTSRQQLPGEARPARLDSVQYNELGQVTRKTIGTGRLTQNVDYAYNIRGWLTSLNNPYAPDPADLFSLSLHYEAGFTRGYEQYNGNLTGQTWRGRDGVQRAYGYVYDPLNRLLQGDFVARTPAATPSAGAWTQELDNYRLSFVSYDDNGNLATLRRRGLLQAGNSHRPKQYGAVDNLSYAYQGNRLQAVDDAVSGNETPRLKGYQGAPTSLAGDFQEAGVKLGQEYGYDANGNLTQDKNKGITGILYNHLNLPRQIHFGQVGDSVVFRYAASGQKVAKLVYQTGTPTPQRTDYLGPYQYEQDSLKFFPHAEGRVLRFVQYDAANQAHISYQREYTLKDHLGNLRLAYRAGQVRTLLATLEQDAPTHKRESQQFDSLSVSAPVAQATTLARSGQYVARLNAGGSTPQPLGPLTQLGVQKGDTVTVSAFGYYAQPVQHGFFFTLGSFLAGLFHPAQAPPPGFEASKRKDLPLLQVGVAAGLASIPQLGGGVPKGYLRVLVFDKDSALVAQPVQALSQAANGGYERLRLQVLVPQDGYVSAYVGNESDVDVLFDDVQVEHRPGLQVQETQYDPAGLELAGLAAPSPGIRGLNNYRFNGKEFQADLGLAWNHQDWRMYDAQIDHMPSVDPEIENGQESMSPYAFGYDNAVRYNDPNGRCPTCLTALAGAAIGAAIGAGIEAGTQLYQHGEVGDWKAVGGAALQGGVTGGLAGLTGGTSLLSVAATGALSNAAGGAARNAYDGQAITAGSIAKDAVIGAASGVGGALAGKAIKAAYNASTGRMVGALREATQGKGNFGVGELSKAETEKVGEAWVGSGAKQSSNGKALISQDGTRQYRPATAKSSSFAKTGTQANLQSRNTVMSDNVTLKAQKAWQNNAHIDVR